jgi:alcohol dehydrogenase class IV
VSLRFAHESLAQRVVFATGEAADRVADEVTRVQGSRVMAIGADNPRIGRVLSQLPVAVRHTEVVMHVPVAVAKRACDVAAEHEVDVIVCVGGGSTTGLAKAVALTTGVPIVAVPTTYAGSEATNVWGLTDGGRKTTGVDPRVLPRSVVYDAGLTTSLPVTMSIASGLNAMAHCVDSMWAPSSDPINQAMALEGMRALRQSLPVVAAAGNDIDGREQILFGAYLSAVAFASAGSGLHHKICHVLGGMYNLPHAQTHAVVLPHVLALNGPSVLDLEQRMAQALGSESALAGLQQLRESVSAPKALRDFGLTEADLPRAVESILPAVPASNPVIITEDNLYQLLQGALEGTEPR